MDMIPKTIPRRLIKYLMLDSWRNWSIMELDDAQISGYGHSEEDRRLSLRKENNLNPSLSYQAYRKGQVWVQSNFYKRMNSH